MLTAVPQGIGLLLCMTGAIILALPRTPDLRTTKQEYKAGMAKFATVLLSVGFSAQTLAFALSLWF